MSPEAEMADFADQLHLNNEHTDFLLSLLQQARGLGSRAGAAAEREECAQLAEEIGRAPKQRDNSPADWRQIAAAIRARKDVV